MDDSNGEEYGHVCFICGENSADEIMKSAHMNQVHSIKTEYKCFKCCMYFHTESSVIQHMNSDTHLESLVEDTKEEIVEMEPDVELESDVVDISTQPEEIPENTDIFEDSGEPEYSEFQENSEMYTVNENIEMNIAQ